MRARSVDIEQALDELADRITEKLAAAGWRRRDLGGWSVTNWSREAGNGVIATASIHRASFGWPDNWPVEITVRLGVGYEPALNLMPLVTARPQLSLHAYPETLSVALASAGDVSRISEKVVSFIDTHAVSFANGFGDGEQIEAALAGNSIHRLTLLAVVGEQARVRTALAEYPITRDWKVAGARDRRFVRQLTRWLDAGSIPAPPIEETLALLPPEVRPRMPSWFELRGRSRRRSEADRVIKARAKGRTAAELVELIAAEYALRGVKASPVLVALQAEQLYLRHGTFGRVRRALYSIAIAKAVVSDLIRMLKSGRAAGAEWLQPPDRAAFPLPTRSASYTAIELDADAQAWLTQSAAQASTRAGPVASFQVWLRSGDDPSEGSVLIAHVGQRRVGTVTPRDRHNFVPVMAAAKLFDEDVVAPGQFYQPRYLTSPVLAIPLPDHPGPPALTSEEPTSRSSRRMATRLPRVAGAGVVLVLLFHSRLARLVRTVLARAHRRLRTVRAGRCSARESAVTAARPGPG